MQSSEQVQVVYWSTQLFLWTGPPVSIYIYVIDKCKICHADLPCHIYILRLRYKYVHVLYLCVHYAGMKDAEGSNSDGMKDDNGGSKSHKSSSVAVAETTPIFSLLLPLITYITTATLMT